MRYEIAVAKAGYRLLSEPMAQVVAAVKAVFESWLSDRAKSYRARQGMDGAIGTAANVQAMVFGNMGKTSGTGVAFSRDPSSGEAGLIGDFLIGRKVQTWWRAPIKPCPCPSLAPIVPILSILAEALPRLARY